MTFLKTSISTIHIFSVRFQKKKFSRSEFKIGKSRPSWTFNQHLICARMTDVASTKVALCAWKQTITTTNFSFQISQTNICLHYSETSFPNFLRFCSERRALTSHASCASKRSWKVRTIRILRIPCFGVQFAGP